MDKKKMRSLFVFSLAFVCGALSFAAPTRAEDPPPAELGRYTMTPTEGGVLRLDTKTGSVSFCSVKDGLSACRAGADEKAALESEISRLSLENAGVSARLSGPPEVQPKSPSGLPSEEEFERTLSFTERFLRRILKVFREEAPGDKS